MNNFKSNDMYISDLIIKDEEQIDLSDLFFDEPMKKAVNQIIREYKLTPELLQYDLPVNNKILLHRSSACGSTATGKAIAIALGKELLVLNLSNVICAKMGETAQNIKMVFDKASREKSVLFLDEFDQIAKLRSLDDKDVGEIRRLVTSIFQLIDYYPADAILICATNHLDFIDLAILRRFQLQIAFTIPDEKTLDLYYDGLLKRYLKEITSIERKYEISFVEAQDHTLNAVKELLISRIENSPKSAQI